MKRQAATHMPGGKKEDPRYGQVIGHVPKELIKRFKMEVLNQETNISEALEQAILLWLEAIKSGSELPETMDRVDKRRKADGN